ncbi:unnamed protein product [Peniophora sp. CBMAI 1063]|nr:unnamed protein product [Peniophora sp. CBMAI 1063]
MDSMRQAQSSLVPYASDSYIARMLRLSHGAYVQYMTSLLSAFPSRPILQGFHPDRRIFAHTQHPSSASDVSQWVRNPLPTGDIGYLVDYEADDTFGEVIPQDLWHAGGSEGNARRLMDQGVLQPPIFFIRRNGEVGISLIDANAGATSQIVGENSPANLGGKTTKHLCLNWTGYSEYKKQVETQDTHKRPITLGRLIHRVGRHVDSYLQVMHEHFDSQDPFWASYLGYSWRQGPDAGWKNSLVIVGIIHVSQGVWQPVLQVRGWYPSNASR